MRYLEAVSIVCYIFTALQHCGRSCDGLTIKAHTLRRYLAADELQRRDKMKIILVVLFLGVAYAQHSPEGKQWPN